MIVDGWRQALAAIGQSLTLDYTALADDEPTIIPATEIDPDICLARTRDSDG